MASFSSVPPEIVNEIVKHLKWPPRQITPAMATICKHTQAAFEAPMFWCLNLNRTRFAALEQHMNRSRWHEIRRIIYSSDDSLPYVTADQYQQALFREIDEVLGILHHLEQIYGDNPGIDFDFMLHGSHPSAQAVELANGPNSSYSCRSITRLRLFAFTGHIQGTILLHEWQTFVAKCPNTTALDLRVREWPPATRAVNHLERDRIASRLASLKARTLLFQWQSYYDAESPAQPWNYVLDRPYDLLTNELGLLLSSLRSLDIDSTSIDLEHFLNICANGTYSGLHRLHVTAQAIKPDGSGYFPPVERAVLRRFKKLLRKNDPMSVEEMWQAAGLALVDASIFEHMILTLAKAVAEMPNIESLRLDIDPAAGWNLSIDYPREFQFRYWIHNPNELSTVTKNDYSVNWYSKGIETISKKAREAWLHAGRSTCRPFQIISWPREHD